PRVEKSSKSWCSRTSQRSELRRRSSVLSQIEKSERQCSPGCEKSESCFAEMARLVIILSTGRPERYCPGQARQYKCRSDRRYGFWIRFLETGVNGCPTASFGP